MTTFDHIKKKKNVNLDQRLQNIIIRKGKEKRKQSFRLLNIERIKTKRADYEYFWLSRCWELVQLFFGSANDFHHSSYHNSLSYYHGTKNYDLTEE